MSFKYIQGFLRCFSDPIRVPRIRENRDPRIREIGSLPGTGHFAYKKLIYIHSGTPITRPPTASGVVRG